MKKIKFLPLIVILIFLLAGCGKATKEDVQNEIKNGDYKTAVKDLKDLSDSEKTQMAEKFKGEIEVIKTKFSKNEIDEVKATEALTDIKLVDGMTTLADDAIEVVKNIASSKASFKSAKESEKSGEIAKAMEEYLKVIKEDVTNYDIAQAKVSQLGEKLKGDEQLIVQSTKIEPDYFSINDNVSVIVKNKSSKVVKEFTIGIALYDANGYPIKSGTLANDDHVFRGKAENANIQPGKTYGGDSAWNLYTDYGTVKKVIACVDTVTYYDGTEWENPYYKVWYNKYYEKPLQ